MPKRFSASSLHDPDNDHALGVVADESAVAIRGSAATAALHDANYD
jgi:hypothetical protein